MLPEEDRKEIGPIPLEIKIPFLRKEEYLNINLLKFAPIYLNKNG